jgi:large repetitive protein
MTLQSPTRSSGRESVHAGAVGRRASLSAARWKRSRWLITLLLATVCLLALAPPAAHADEPTFATRRLFGTGDDVTYSVAVGDMNGDGHLDVVIGNYGRSVNNVIIGEQNVVYLNDGQGNFSTPRFFGTGSDHTRSVAVGDVDGDGHLDIVVGNFDNQQNMIYLNDGQGNFSTGRPFGTGSDSTGILAVADMNGDGYLDIIAGNDGQNVVYLNDGSGNFLEARNFGTTSGSTRSLAIADMNGDGYLDIIAGNHQHNFIYLNDGQGNFPTEIPFDRGNDRLRSITLGDINGDGHLDIVTGNDHQYNAVYLNSGPMPAPLPFPSACAAPRCAC